MGRTGELGAIGAFLDEARRGSVALIFGGDPGIGKTTIWLAAVELARERGVRVLQTRAGPAEARLTYVGMADLLDTVEGAVLAALPNPQRRALDVSLLRTDPAAVHTGQRVVSTAFMSVLRTLCADAPVLIAIDDLQWLDTASRHVLEFALRRLDVEPVGLLATARTSDAATAQELIQAMPPGRARLAEVGGLSATALQQILDDRLGHQLPRPALVRIMRTAGGNPMYATEIGRALLELPAEARAAVPPPISEDLRTLLVRRLRRLPAACQHALLVAAAQAQPRALALDGSALAPAERAGVVVLNRGRITFTHPLLASAIYGSAPAAARRRVHRELADRAYDQEERARHLALGAAGASADIAAALTEAAAQTRSRGAPDAAANLLELAASVTPGEQVSQRRSRHIAAAENHFHAGDRARARALAAQIAEQVPAGALLGRALRLLGMISYHEDSYGEAIRLLAQAVDHLRDDPLIVDLHVNLAHVRVSLGDLSGGAQEAAAAVAQARHFGDKALEASALAVAVMADLFAGQPPDWERLDQALLMEDPDRQVAIQVRPTWIAGGMRLYCDQLDEARPYFTALRQRMIERGEESDLPFLSFHLAMLERLAGDLAAAQHYAEEAYDLACQLGSRNLQLVTLGERCYARTMAGDVAAARADAEDGLALAAQTPYPAGITLAHASAGFLRLSLGDMAGAAAVLDPLAQIVEQTGFCHAVLAWYLPDAIEAFTATGWLDRAESCIGPMVQAGSVAGRPHIKAVAGRCHALLLAARGELGEALAAADQALVVGGSAHLALDLGRTLLLKGQLHRRQRQKQQARQALQDSLAVFERIGAPLWVHKARGELARVGQRTAAGNQLTATEERVATLAAAGLTNREIAERSFLSPKTVEANLVRVYRKLGIHSRAELGARMGAREGAAEDRRSAKA